MIQLGDIITHINDVPTHSIDNVHALLHENTSLALKLSMLRCSTPFILFLEKKPLEQNKSFHGYVRENVAVIQLGFIQKDSREKIESFLLSLKKQGIFQNIHGLLIDIRHNPGGRLDDAINILSLFLDHKLAYILQGKLKEDRQKIFTISHPLFLDIPMVVLADHLTASAAELMAGALQHHKRALLVGENTYGKNGIQSLFKMPGMGGIKVTTAYFLTPSGDNISKKGLTPNIAFKKDDHLPPTSPSIDPWQAQSIHLLHQLALKGAQS
jgi:carboxyl-terminal processing protease